MKDSFFQPLAEASVVGGIFLLIYLGLRPVLRRALGTAMLSVFWAVVLLRFVVLWPLLAAWGAAQPWAAEKESGAPWKAMVSWGEAPTPAKTKPAAATATGQREVSPAGLPVVPTGWAAGALFCLALQMRNAWRLRRFVRSARVVTTGPVQVILRSFPEGWTRGMEVRLTRPGSSPMLTGLLRPCICLPEDWVERLERSELRHLLMHEIGHARRGDLFLQAMMGVVQCVHWFNPLVWIAPRYLRLDLEFGCDGWVLQRSEDEARREYGATLIKTSQWVKASDFQASMGMAAGRRTLFARIDGVSRFRSTAWWQTAAGTVVAMAVTFLLLTSRSSAETKSEKASPAEKATQFSIPSPAPVDGRVPQVEVESKFMEMPESVWKSLGWSNDEGTQTSILTAQQRQKLLTSLSNLKGVDLLSTPKVTTRAGQRAMIQIVREFRYATEWEPNPKHPGKLVPTSWETKPLGVTLEVEPTVSADGATIELEISPRVSELTGFVRQNGQPFTWERNKLPDSLNPPADMFPKDEMVQPIFSTREITTSVVLRRDQAVLFGGLKKQGSPEEKDGLLLFVLVQANTLQPPKDKAAPAQTSSPQ